MAKEKQSKVSMLRAMRERRYAEMQARAKRKPFVLLDADDPRSQPDPALACSACGALGALPATGKCGACTFGAAEEKKG